jgi:hypothetical protein
MVNQSSVSPPPKVQQNFWNAFQPAGMGAAVPTSIPCIPTVPHFHPHTFCMQMYLATSHLILIVCYKYEVVEISCICMPSVLLLILMCHEKLQICKDGGL